MSRLTIEEVDVDGAIREGADAVAGDTRSGFMAKAALGAGGLVGGGALLAALPGIASAASRSDISILNFALTLEYLESTFYAEAIAKKGLGKREMAFARTVHAHEQEHVAALKKVLGSHAIKKPSFAFGSATSTGFVKTAITLEDTGVRAYKGQAPYIQSTTILKAALAIHSVEANHAAWIRFIAGADPTYSGAFELPLTKTEVLAAVKKTGFITKM
jgi:rubrerythrin